jgi:hypothetical protein
MRKLIKNLSTLALVATFAFVAVATVNLEFSNLSNLEVTQTVAFANDGGGGGEGKGGTGYYYYTCSDGYTSYPACNNQCVIQAPQTQTLT